MSKETVHDERIAPLMTQVIEICRAEGISMIASFAVPSDDDPDLRCTTNLADETGTFVFADACRLIRHGQHSVAPLMLTTRDRDGNATTMTAVVG